MLPKEKIRAIVADDSALTRRAICRMLESDPDIDVVSLAKDGKDVLEKIRHHRPDVVTLDVSMPVLDGISALKTILSEKLCPAIMVSSLTERSAEVTLEALSLGAFDCIAKPNASRINSLYTVSDDLIRKVRAAVTHSRLNHTYDQHRETAPQPADPIHFPHHHRLDHDFSPQKAIAIGISTGGPTTIQSVLPLLPSSIHATVYLVQHMPVNFTASFSRRLGTKCSIPVLEATDGAKAQKATCYVGQGGTHLIPTRLSDGSICIHCPTTPETMFMPSVDCMFRAVTEAYGAENTIGVLMTGIGHDGAEALHELKLAGGYTIAESEESSVVFGMPKSAIERGAVCEVLPKEQIAQAILRHLNTEVVR